MSLTHLKMHRNYKFTKSQKINHLMYMNDMKLFTKNAKELETDKSNKNIGMEFSWENGPC